MNKSDKKKLASLLKENNARKDDKLSYEYGHDIYLLQDSSLVYVDNGGFSQFKNSHELEEAINNHVWTRDILFGKNPFGWSFPEHTRELISELLNELNITPVTDIVDLETIRAVDAELDKRKDKKEFSEKYLIHCMALVGELVIKEKGCEWKMSLGEDGETWHPQLVLDGEPVALFRHIIHELVLGETPKQSLLFVHTTILDIIKFNLGK